MGSSLLSVQRVVKEFGGLRAVNEPSFTVEEGEIIGLIGPNGAGKTTLFNMISGFYRPDSGSIVFRGINTAGLKPHQICRLGLARTFQIVKPFGKLTVLQNVATGALHGTESYAQALERAWQCLDTTALADRAHRPASDLTVSEQRRLELARALATKPRLLLLDEVMAGLNPVEVDDMLSLLRKIAADGVTLLIIEHVMRAIMTLSHRIIVLHQGALIATGTPEVVARDRNVIEAYLGEEPTVA